MLFESLRQGFGVSLIVLATCLHCFPLSLCGTELPMNLAKSLTGEPSLDRHCDVSEAKDSAQAELAG